jgi:adenosylmethionine-8-amino-7-oxononanoate aminotransferase
MAAPPGLRPIDDLAAMDRAHAWHPQTRMDAYLESEPVILEKGKGATLFDSQGNRYIDGISSQWVNIHGHARAEINVAVNKQFDRVAHTSLVGLANPPTIRLARRLADLAGGDLRKVYFTTTGASAITSALRFAIHAHARTGNVSARKRRKIAWFDGSAHAEAVSSVRETLRFGANADPSAPLIKDLPLVFPESYRTPEGNTPESIAAAAIDAIRASGNELAAVIVEPMVQIASGVRTGAVETLVAIRKACDDVGALLIVDETATAFGRTGAMFASQAAGVTADILCVANGLAGGYLPLAATIASQRVYDMLAGDPAESMEFRAGHAHSGNAASCAAALASLDLFTADNTLETLQEKIVGLTQGLERYRELKNVGDVRQRGFVVGIELVADKASKLPFKPEEGIGESVASAARRRGVLIRPLGDVIVIMPPLAITPGELATLIDVVYDAIKVGVDKRDTSRRMRAVSPGTDRIRRETGRIELPPRAE